MSVNGLGQQKTFWQFSHSNSNSIPIFSLSLLLDLRLLCGHTMHITIGQKCRLLNIEEYYLCYRIYDHYGQLTLIALPLYYLVDSISIIAEFTLHRA